MIIIMSNIFKIYKNTKLSLKIDKQTNPYTTCIYPKCYIQAIGLLKKGYYTGLFKSMTFIDSLVVRIFMPGMQQRFKKHFLPVRSSEILF